MTGGDEVDLDLIFRQLDAIEALTALFKVEEEGTGVESCGQNHSSSEHK